MKKEYFIEQLERNEEHYKILKDHLSKNFDSKTSAQMLKVSHEIMKIKNQIENCDKPLKTIKNVRDDY